MIAEKSFKSNIPTDDIFMDKQHKEVLARIEFVIQNCGIFLLYGETGSGKSTIIRTSISGLDSSRYFVCYINNSRLTPRNLYGSILESMAVEPYSMVSKVKKQFYQVVTDVFNNHQKQPVVFIDNAQSLPVETINEIRYMRSFEFDSVNPMTLILVGQPELLPTLKLRTFEPLFYRINSLYHFKGLNQDQASEYIAKQLALSGLSMLFPDDVIAKIWSCSKGLPQIINTICASCLIDMEANSLNLVDNDVFKKVLNLITFQDVVINAKLDSKGDFYMFNFSANNLAWISTKQYERYLLHMMMDTDTKRCYLIYDFGRQMTFEKGPNYCISGKVNSADKLYLVAENMKIKPKKTVQ